MSTDSSMLKCFHSQLWSKSIFSSLPPSSIEYTSPFSPFHIDEAVSVYGGKYSSSSLSVLSGGYSLYTSTQSSFRKEKSDGDERRTSRNLFFFRHNNQISRICQRASNLTT